MIMETVAFYSYKGGVGRTLLVANTAQFLAMSGRKVVALDLDLEAPGLHQKLGSRDDLKRAEAGTLRGAVDELLGILGNEPGGRSLQETAIKVPLPDDAKEGFLRVIPAGSAPSHAYWAGLEKLSHILRASSCTGGLPEAVLELRARIREEFKPDFLLIDSRTGITELGGLATSLLADRVVCLTTTAPESVDGTKVVADALRKAPRLSSQKPVQIDFLITRVVSEGSSNVSTSKKQLEALGNSVAILPHDPGIADEEQVISTWRAAQSNKRELFSATLDWIAESFPGHNDEAKRARRRMEQVQGAWNELTRSWQDLRRGSAALREPWSVEQLREREIFTSGNTSRQADIAAYNSMGDADPLMIVEYVEDEDREAVADWWFANTRVKAVSVLPEIRGEYQFSTRVISREGRSGRHDLPSPYDFKALTDPTDVSVDSLLEAVRCGFDDYRKYRENTVYLDRIAQEWVRYSQASFAVGATWRPRIAKRILDNLARVDDMKLAGLVLRAASPDWKMRGRWWGDGDERFDEQLLGELFAPLFWRLPPEVSIDVMREGGRGDRLEGGPCGTQTIGLLARDMLGLRYDPDSTFRIEGERVLERSGWDFEKGFELNRIRGLDPLASAFEHMEISFEISSGLPPLAAPQIQDGEEKRQSVAVARLVAERIANRSLVTTSLLADYQPGIGRVVLYKDAISQCADKLDLKPRHVGSVVLIHETLHALMHLGRDLDGRMWTEFALPDASSPLFEPSWFHETLTQYFTYQHILRLRDPALMHAFEAMSAKSAAPYRAWERLRDLPIEDARNWLMSVRRGVGAAPLSVQMLLHAPPDRD